MPSTPPMATRSTILPGTYAIAKDASSSAVEGGLRFRQIPDFPDRSRALRRDRGFIAMNETAGIDEHAAVDHDLVDIGAVGECDQCAPDIEQRLQMRVGQIDDGEIGGRPRRDPAEIGPLDDVGGGCGDRLD